MRLHEILKEFNIPDSAWELAGVNPHIVRQMIAKSASFLRQYMKPGISPFEAVEQWLQTIPWSEMTEMWHSLPMHPKIQLARYLVTASKAQSGFSSLLTDTR